MMTKRELFGLVLGLTATACWGAYYLLGRFLFGNYAIHPLMVSFLQFFIASIVCVVVIGVRGEGSQVFQALRTGWPFFLGLAFAGIVGEGVLLIYSLKYTTAARSCLFANTSPIFTVLLAAWLMREPLGARKLFGMVLGFAGMAVVLLKRGGGDLFVSGTSMVGDVLALISGISWALYTVMGRKAGSEFSPMVSSTLSIIIGDLILLVLVLLLRVPWPLNLPLGAWIYVAVLGVFCYGVAFIFWLAALKYLEAGKVGALGYVSVILATGGSWLLLKEQLTVQHLFGMVLLLTGVYYMINVGKGRKLSA